MNRKKALALIQSYLLNSDGKTIRQLSLMLCHDLDISYRSARENYVLPLKEHGFLVATDVLSFFYVFDEKALKK